MPRPPPERRSYRQYCGLARALDVVGDRWTLLVVRELLVGPGRFGEIQAGLPGIATNLLTDRLRQLERDGLVARRLGDRGTAYALTSRGEELRPAVEALVRWSAPLMAVGPGDDAFQAGWLAVALPALVRARPSRRIRASLRTRGGELLLEAGPRGTSVTRGGGEPAESRLVAAPEIILALAAGALDVRGACRAGAKATGDRVALEELFRAGGVGRGRGASPASSGARGRRA